MSNTDHSSKPKIDDPFEEQNAEPRQEQTPSISEFEQIEKLKLQQNLPLAMMAGAGAAIASGIVWAVITVATEFQIGYMAVAVGFIVGYAIRFTGKGIDQIFGIMGAAFALFGCLLGNFLTIVGFIGSYESLTYFEVLSQMDYSLVPELMTDTFSFMDILFYGIALYEGYQFSFRQITEEDLAQIS